MNRIVLLTASACLTILGGCDSDSQTAATNPAAESAAKTAPAQTAGTSGAEIDRKYTQAVKERQSVLTLLRRNYGPLGDMARDRAPYDAAVVQENSVHLQNLGAMLGDTFITDTRGTGVETEALDKIWEEPEAFARKVAAFRSSTDALVVAAASGDKGTVVPAIGRVGKACGSCHDDYRVDDD